MEYFTHKFRATIGKHKILAKDEDVLFAYSGSGASVAMLHLISQVRYLSNLWSAGHLFNLSTVKYR